jgi:hypothetical protein
MAAALSGNELLAQLKERAHAMGLDLHDEGSGTVKGEKQSILVKWLLGQKKTIYRMAIRLAEAEHVVKFREMVKETSWGILPPTITVEKTGVKGWERTGTHKEISPFGGGTVDYAELREAMRKIVTDAGWQFQLEGGRAP